MKFVLRYPGDSGFLVSKPITIENDDPSVQDILDAIDRVLSSKNLPYFVKIYKEGISIRVIPGFPLSLYDIKNDSTKFYIEYIESDDNDDDLSTNFYQKLGFTKNHLDNDFADIKEAPSHEEFESDNPSRNSYNPSSPSPRKLNSLNTEQINYLISSKLKKLVKEIKSQNPKCFKEYFDLEKELLIEIPEYKKDEIHRLLEKNLLSLTPEGWNIFHYAVFDGNLEIVSETINPDVNLPAGNSDLTPLQLAIYKGKVDVLKYLLEISSIEVNRVTSKGSSLHYAVKLKKFNIVKILLDFNADIFLKDNEDRLFYEYAETSQEKEELMILANINESLLKTVISQLNEKPEIPVSLPKITTGILFKVGAMSVTLNERFFVINPLEGTLIRYKKKNDYPYRPLEIIPLTEISLIQRTSKYWYLRKNLYYFEFFTSDDKKHVMGCRKKEQACKWIESLYRAIVYYKNIDRKIKEEFISPYKGNHAMKKY